MNKQQQIIQLLLQNKSQHTPSQQAKIVDSIRGYKHGGVRKGKHKKQNLLTISQATKIVGITNAQYERTKNVEKYGSKKLIHAMNQFQIKVSVAAKLALNANKSQQNHILKQLEGQRITITNIMQKLQHLDTN